MKYKFIKLYYLSIVLFGCLLLLFSCKLIQTPSNQKETERAVIVPTQEYTVQSVLWQQISSEYKALAYQTYNLAKEQLDIILTNQSNSIQKPLAIITDIDETVLDNSPFFGKQIESDIEFSKEKWVEWGKMIGAKSIPGATEFFNYAQSKGVEVFYISNRYDGQKEETIKNLEKVGLPYADTDHVLLKSDTSEKKSRRQKVQETHKVIMLFGDNLSDFSELFEVNSTFQRNYYCDSLKLQFGKKFFVLPNPIYGDWEGRGVYEGNYNRSPSEKSRMRNQKIISY